LLKVALNTKNQIKSIFCILFYWWQPFYEICQQCVSPHVHEVDGLLFSVFLPLGLSWSWLYGSWIYNYLCNQCLSPLKLWVLTLFMARCTWYNIMW
jgi:hypothetical protein